MKKRTVPNPKRKLAPPPGSETDIQKLACLASQARYGGNSEHKRNPGDFGLSPPSNPRQGKTLCDEAMVFTRTEAERLLQEGLRHGLVSVQARNGWPQNVWAVAKNGIPLEAELENREMGVYHGYPMFSADPLRDAVLKRWTSP